MFTTGNGIKRPVDAQDDKAMEMSRSAIHELKQERLTHEYTSFFNP